VHVLLFLIHPLHPNRKTGRLVSTRQPSMEGGMEGHVGHLCIPLISYSNYMSLNMHNYSALFGQSMVSHSLHCSIHVVAFLEFVYFHSLADLWLPKGCTTPARTRFFFVKSYFLTIYTPSKIQFIYRATPYAHSF
jgi:hypothetical protein